MGEQLSAALDKAGTALSATATTLGLNPNADNWAASSTGLGNNRYRLTLKMKRLHGGGDGEAWQIFSLYAAQLAQEQGFDHYRTLNYQEAINSAILASQRTATGTIQLENP